MNSLFRFTPRQRNPNQWPRATWHNSANYHKSSYLDPVTTHILGATALPSVLTLSSVLHRTPSTCLALSHLTGSRRTVGRKMEPAAYSRACASTQPTPKLTTWDVMSLLSASVLASVKWGFDRWELPGWLMRTE